MSEAAQSAVSPPGPVRLGSIGPIDVSTPTNEVSAFKAETGWLGSADKALAPHTFPMRWLSLPPVKSVLEQTIQGLGAVAFHESQSFAYEKLLAVGGAYQMDVTIDQQAEPARLVLQVKVTQNGVPVVSMETILRLIFAAAQQ